MEPVDNLFLPTVPCCLLINFHRFRKQKKNRVQSTTREKKQVNNGNEYLKHVEPKLFDTFSNNTFGGFLKWDP